MKPKLIINRFNLGIMDDITQPVSNGFAFGAGIDIQKEPGILQVSQRLDQMTEAAATNNITDRVKWMVKYSNSGLSKIFALGCGRIYSYDVGQSSKWALTHVDIQAGGNSQGMIEYNGNIYWASRDYLGRLTSDTLAEDLDDSEAEIDLTDSTKYGSSGSIICGSEVITFSGNVANTLSGCGRGAYGSTAATHTSGATIYGFNNGYKSLTTDTNWHPMCIFGDYLAIGSGRYIEHLSSAGTLTSTAVDLPLGYKIKSLAVYGNKLYIGTWKGSNIYEQPEAKLFSCTMTQMLSGTFEEVTSIKECGINAMIVWKNNLIVFAGIAGNIYAYNGATLTKIKTIPRIESNTGDWAYVEPGAVIEYQGNLLFGVSSTSADYAGIYMFDKDSLALTSSHILSTGDFTDVEINSLCNVGTNQFYVSYLDGTSGAFSIDAISTTKRITSTAFWESQIYDIENEDGFNEVNGFELIMKPLATGNSVAVKYKKDNASSWSTWGTITSTNQVAPLWVAIGLAKTLQIRLEFTTNTSSNDSPSILAIKIY